MKYVFAIITILGKYNYNNILIIIYIFIISSDISSTSCYCVTCVETYKYRFPLTLCNSSSDTWFNPSVIIDVILAIGVCLLIIVVWTINSQGKLTN